MYNRITDHISHTWKLSLNLGSYLISTLEFPVWHSCLDSTDTIVENHIWFISRSGSSTSRTHPKSSHFHMASTTLSLGDYGLPSGLSWSFPNQSSCFHPFFPESVLHPVCVACSLGTRGLAITFLINSESFVGLCDPASSSRLTLSPTKDPQWLHCSLHLLAPGLFPPCRMPLPRFLRLDSFHLSSLVTLRGLLGGSIISFYFFKFSLPYTMLSV